MVLSVSKYINAALAMSLLHLGGAAAYSLKPAFAMSDLGRVCSVTVLPVHEAWSQSFIGTVDDR